MDELDKKLKFLTQDPTARNSKSRKVLRAWAVWGAGVILWDVGRHPKQASLVGSGGVGFCRWAGVGGGRLAAWGAIVGFVTPSALTEAKGKLGCKRENVFTKEATTNCALAGRDNASGRCRQRPDFRPMQVEAMLQARASKGQASGPSKTEQVEARLQDRASRGQASGPNKQRPGFRTEQAEAMLWARETKAMLLAKVQPRLLANEVPALKSDEASLSSALHPSQPHGRHPSHPGGHPRNVETLSIPGTGWRAAPAAPSTPSVTAALPHTRNTNRSTQPRPPLQELEPAFNKLRIKAASRVREFVMQKIYTLKVWWRGCGGAAVEARLAARVWCQCGGCVVC
eukprot:353666-Chlamydomonas_euryale.AAC.2